MTNLIAKTSDGYYIGLELQGGMSPSDNRYMIYTNSWEWHDVLSQDLQWDQFGTKQELEPILKEFAEKHNLAMISVDNRGNEL